MGFPQGHPGNWTPSILSSVSAPPRAARLLLGEGAVVEMGFSNAQGLLSCRSSQLLFSIPRQAVRVTNIRAES